MTAQSSIEQFHFTNVDPAVRGFLHRPHSPNGDALVLAHGAGSNANAPLLVAIATELAERGWTVLRCNLPYRQLRPAGPPGPGDASRDRAGLKNAITAMRELLAFGMRDARETGRVFMGGHSYGGRQASMLCAEEPGLAAGLLLLSYPLHPPGKRDQKRVQHLPKLTTPALFVHGTRDPFGLVDEMREAFQLIPARTRLFVVEGAGHDLIVKKKLEAVDLPRKIADEFVGYHGDANR